MIHVSPKGRELGIVTCSQLTNLYQNKVTVSQLVFLSFFPFFMSFFRSFLCFAVEIMNTEKLFNMIIQAGN
jgi:hypothetical protein